jgi:predicted phage terminase large subunit-like protein
MAFSDISQQDAELLEKISMNWRLTPATLAYKLSLGKWIPSPWLLYTAQIVAQAIAKGNGRIIISAPPRHGKSQLIDIYTPVWIMENFPGYHTIMTSYGADLSVDFGRKVRDMIQDNSDLLNVKIRSDARKVDSFLTDTGGGMTSVGLGGAITGKGAHVLLVDDYIKEIKEALSPTYRNYVWNWFTTTAFTRLEPGGTCIIIATRWHSDDLIGRILKAFPGQWTNIVLPAIAEKGDILGRSPGDPLFPERYPTPVLMERLDVLGSAFFQALFQQRPIDEAKKLADGSWLKIVDIHPQPSKLELVRIWDLAATANGGDYTVGTLSAYDRSTGYYYILNVVRKQLSPGDVETLVLNTAIADGTDTEIGIEQEPGSSGKALVEHYQKTVLPEFKVKPIVVANKGAKVLRAQPFLAAAEAGKVFLLAGSWNKTFIDEFDSFPGEYDDQVDTAAAGYTKLSGKLMYGATWGREMSPGIGRGRSTSNADARRSGREQRAAEFNLARPIGVTWGQTDRQGGTFPKLEGDK